MRSYYETRVAVKSIVCRVMLTAYQFALPENDAIVAILITVSAADARPTWCLAAIVRFRANNCADRDLTVDHFAKKNQKYSCIVLN